MASVLISWVKGHLNGEKTIQHKLNDEAHSLACEFLTRDQGYYNPSTSVLDPPYSGISILFDNSTLTSKMSTFSREQLTAVKIQATICKSEKWEEITFNRVDWDSYGRALSHASRCDRISLIKLSHKLCNTNYQNKEYYGNLIRAPAAYQKVRPSVFLVLRGYHRIQK